MLAAPEFVVTQLVQELDKVEIAAELQHRMLTDRVVRGEEGAEASPWHEVDAPVSCRSIHNAPAVELVGLVRWPLVGPLGHCCVGQSVVRCFSSSPCISSPMGISPLRSARCVLAVCFFRCDDQIDRAAADHRRRLS